MLQGEGVILNQNKNGTNLNFEIKNASEMVKLEFPYIYYLGYSAELVNENGNVSKLKIKESDKGFCMVEVSNLENGKIKVKYEGTTLMKISYVLTIAGVILIFIKILLHQLTNYYK